MLKKESVHLHHFDGVIARIGDIIINTEDLYFFRLSNIANQITAELSDRLNSDKMFSHEQFAQGRLTILQAAILNAFLDASNMAMDPMDLTHLESIVFKPSRYGLSNPKRSLKECMERIDMKISGHSCVIQRKQSAEEHRTLEDAQMGLFDEDINDGHQLDTFFKNHGSGFFSLRPPLQDISPALPSNE